MSTAPETETQTPARPGRLMHQRDIAREYGVPTGDVLRYVQMGRFPMPVQVVNHTRWFRRADVARWAKDRKEGEGG